MEIKRSLYGVFSRNLSNEQIEAVEEELGDRMPRTFGVTFRKCKESSGDSDVMMSDIISKLKLRSADVQQRWKEILASGSKSEWLLEHAELLSGDVDAFKMHMRNTVAKHLPFSNMLLRALHPDQIHRLELICNAKSLPKPKKRSKKRGSSDIDMMADGLRNDLERMKAMQEMLNRPERQFQDLRDCYAMLPIVATCGIADVEREEVALAEEADTDLKHKHKKKKKKHSHSKKHKTGGGAKSASSASSASSACSADTASASE